jgi:hypothetical protein
MPRHPSIDPAADTTATAARISRKKVSMGKTPDAREDFTRESAM